MRRSIRAVRLTAALTLYVTVAPRARVRRLGIVRELLEVLDELLIAEAVAVLDVAR